MCEDRCKVRSLVGGFTEFSALRWRRKTVASTPLLGQEVWRPCVALIGPSSPCLTPGPQAPGRIVETGYRPALAPCCQQLGYDQPASLAVRRPSESRPKPGTSHLLAPRHPPAPKQQPRCARLLDCLTPTRSFAPQILNSVEPLRLPGYSLPARSWRFVAVSKGLDWARLPESRIRRHQDGRPDTQEAASEAILHSARRVGPLLHQPICCACSGYWVSKYIGSAPLQL